MCTRIGSAILPDLPHGGRAVYTALMDETRSSDRDLFVYAAVIVRSEDLPRIHTDLEGVAKRFAGSEREEVKYSPTAGSAQDEYCRKHKISSGDCKQAVLDVLHGLGRRATVMAGIMVDPRGAKSPITNATIYSWAFDALLQRYAQFLKPRLDHTTPPRNEVVIDTPNAEPSLFHRMHSDAWHQGWPSLRWRPQPLSDVGCRPKLLVSMARYAPALWLPDHVAGAISDWVRVERQSDEATAARGKEPKPGALPAARARVRPILEQARRPVVSYGLVPWPEDYLDRPTLTGWVSRARTPSPSTR